MWWFNVTGSINPRLLSPETRYDVVLVFRFGRRRSGFTDKQVNVSLTSEGGMNTYTSHVVLDPPGPGVVIRDDGWMELRLGEFFSQYQQDEDKEEEYDDASVSFRIWETNNHDTKNGILIEGVEFRPKDRDSDLICVT